MSVAEVKRLARRSTKARQTQATPDNRTALAFLAPWVLGAAALTLGPIVASLYLAFTDYNLLQNANWVGTANFERMVDDTRLHSALAVTFRYVVIGVPGQLLTALGLALLLDRGLRGRSIYRAAFYLPSMLGASVAIAVLWRLVFGGTGLVNTLLGLFGIHTTTSWIGSPNTALGTIILLHIWTFGSPMVIFLAGLRQIPTELYEAAATDGAGPWRRFRAITLPLLTPFIFFNLVLAMINSFFVLHPGVRRLGRHGRTFRLAVVLHALPVSGRVHVLPDGLCISARLASRVDHRRVHRGQLLALEVLGSLCRLTPTSARPAAPRTVQEPWTMLTWCDSHGSEAGTGHDSSALPDVR
nr:sugar ABC transporter permease [Phytoactinopolyspora alkaliphila]